MWTFSSVMLASCTRALAVCALVTPFTVGQALALDLANGRTIYNVHCAACHGASGEGVFPGAPAFQRGERLMQPDQRLAATISGGKNAMPAFRGVLSERDIWDVVAYVRRLRR